ncbi:MAG: 1-acyl-sn-glycerol-3-phosphate acyltransferase [Gammaproteobacteria bacterium]|nr:1-acyl-sn-glycerol-3-phosphate acyltransferase [Gammaproteobacteria bacterium]MBU1442739.1 1-acyl-sn-glycerol-3-phosphate acyltransferase [Gammaproteobacteria bacterium]MBU2409549.1 1-acyl-sn-glycerol-3-phosphate acyltransferase [Gammaproteobacteria bacterium]
MQTLSASLKLLRAVAHALRGWWTIRTEFPRLEPTQQHQRVQEWATCMLQVLGIRLVVQGTPPQEGPMLIVSNHLSWLDILVIHAARHVRFVSKSGVRDWPLIGAMSTGAGSLYIERERRRDAMRVVHRMTEALRNGDLVAIFPEGTTSDGTGLLPFHANLLQAAISSGSPVLPAALRFADAATGETSLAPRYIDDDNLASSLWNTLKAPPLLAIVRFGEPQSSLGRDRRAWARELHADVQTLRRATH